MPLIFADSKHENAPKKEGSEVVKNAPKMPLKTRGTEKNMPLIFADSKHENAPKKEGSVVVKNAPKMPLKRVLQATKNHPAGVVLEAKMRKTDVLKLGVPTFKITLPTAKKFYILGESAGNGCNLKTKLPTLETKKPLQKADGVLSIRRGIVLSNFARKIIFFSFREVKAILSCSPRSYPLFRKLLTMGYLVCSHIVHKPHKPIPSNPNLGALALVRCLQMCAGLFSFVHSHPI